MTRKDSEKDSERPHYYSQFWLDVAAGRKVIGAPKTNEETEMEPDTESVLSRKPGRNSDVAFSDGYEETISHPEVEPEFEAEEYPEPELDEMELENDVEDTEIPNIIVDETEIPDVDLAPVEEDEEEDELFFDEEDEEEDDLGWGRGRKKPKPGRQTKQPKKPRRETRRGY
jgi:hypothetical protein